VIRSLRIFSRQDQQKIVAITVIQVFLGVIDLLGVAIFGIMGALAVTGVQSKQPSSRVGGALKLIGIDNFAFQSQVAILALIAASALITRTLVSVYFSRKILYFLSRKSAIISGNLIERLLGKDLLYIQSKSVYETLFAVTTGVNAITVGMLATAIAIVADLSLLAIMSLGLVSVDLPTAILTFCLFGAVGLILHKLMSKRAKILGIENAELNIESNEKIVQVLNMFREVSVHGKRSFYSEEISKTRLRLANNSAEVAFMPNISKYVIEVSLVLGGLLVAASSFILNDSMHAIGTLTVFIAAASRIGPAILRLQQGLVQISGSLGVAEPTLALIESLSREKTVQRSLITSEDFDHSDFEPHVKLTDISFRYPNSQDFALKKINLEILSGQVIALVGSSGAGKTTLVDLMLGLIPPDSGDIQISGVDPKEAILKWPGAISYVPQDVYIINGTIRENIAIGCNTDEVQDSEIWEALRLAQLEDFVRKLENQLDSEVSENGSRLSGGQRQRLGIARAMYTKPRLLVFDEATSALDGSTELELNSAIQSLRGAVTIVVIAHRLSTVTEADLVAYMEAGKIQATGSFSDVRETIPEFDRQAKLLGL
jgi:ABC-type multidrug transport system fused ATPase/permease subunit